MVPTARAHKGERCSALVVRAAGAASPGAVVVVDAVFRDSPPATVSLLAVPDKMPPQLPTALVQGAINRPNIDWQEKIHRGILRSLRNISETP